MADEQKSLNQIIQHRKEKLKKLVENGVNPFPYKFEPSHKSLEIINNFNTLEGKTIKIAGRLMAIRKMGKASFAQILDQNGKIQIFIKENNIGDNNYKNFNLLDIGDIVGVSGKVFKTKTNEISINTSELIILAKSIRPLPIVKEKDGKIFDGFKDK